MAKVRVYELAKELGVESKVVMTKLQELGEFVRSASSTVEPPVVRKLREQLNAANGGGNGAGATGRPAARPTPHAPGARPAPAGWDGDQDGPEHRTRCHRRWRCSAAPAACARQAARRSTTPT